MCAQQVRQFNWRLLWLCLIVVCNCVAHCGAQTPKSEWTEGLRLIDSAMDADVTAAIDIFQQARKKSAGLPVEALLGLAACQYRDQQYAAAAQTLASLSTSGDRASMLAQHRGLLLRLRLMTALAIDDSNGADSAFKDLVRLVLSDKSDPLDMRLSAHAIGTVVGMLENPRAASPISMHVLSIGTQQMLQSKVHGVATTYEAAYKQASEVADVLEACFVAIDRDGVDAVAASHAERVSELAEQSRKLDSQKDLTSEVVRNAREQADQNKLDARQLTREISGYAAKLRQPTPGHPGAKRPAPPPPPPRSSIYVDEYETEISYDSEGRRIVRNVRRPQYEIDSQRDRLHRGILSDYTLAMDQYRQYESSYLAALASWTETDRLRRDELNQKKAEAEAKRNQLLEENKDITAEQKASAKDLVQLRTAKQQQELEVQLQEVAILASRAGKPQSAFRPRHFEPFLWYHEKSLLQR